MISFPDTRRAALACLIVLAGWGGTATAQGSVRNRAGADVTPGSRPSVVPIIGRPDTIGRPGAFRRPEPPTASTSRNARKVRQAADDWRRSVDYSGPRFGITYLPKAAVDSLAEHGIDVNATITQFGWQLEREIHISAEGPMILNEWVILVGGLESGVFLPSLTWLVGVRDRSGTEFGIGPNASPGGVALAAAAGVTMHNGGMHFPMNVAVVSAKTGLRVSFLTGFTIR